jgi:hypothetical protein
VIVRTSKGSGISGAVRYVMGEGKLDPETGKAPELAPGEQSRVAWYGGTGFGFPIDSDERLDIARRVMEWAEVTQASKTKKCKEDCFHLMLAWDKDEQPTRQVMEEAAHSVLKDLGMEHARAIWACHDDTDHAHLHIVASRIDPESGKAFRDSFDKTKLSDWALQWEREHGGVRCEARVEKQEKQAERDPEKIINAFAARRETFTAFDLNRELTRAIPSRDTRRQYIAGALERPEIVKLADPETGQVTRYTTRQTLAAEHLAEASGARLFADTLHQVSGRSLHGVLEDLQSEGKALRPDQLCALEHATGPEGLSLISGKAGTGKTFTMSAIARAYEADGYAVTSLAPTNKVASALKRDGLDAGTIHSALGSLDRGRAQWNAKTVVMVDEAGMVSTRLMARLLSHAEEAGAKVILIGDDKQLASMDRGGMFGYFAAEHGDAELSEITRQRGAEQRELATRASQYDFQAGLAALDKQGGLVTVEKPEHRIAKAAEIWGERTAAAPEHSMFVVAVSNADAEAANLAIRQLRRERGELGLDHSFATTDGPKAFAVGDRVLFSGTAASREERSAGLVNGNGGVIATIEGSRMSVALDGAKAGDRVTFTVGKNREAGEFDAIRHGYAGTIYKAQGATYDDAIVIDNPMMRASTGYVALTRHRESVTVVTARAVEPGKEAWMAAQGGLETLAPEQRESAGKSFATWRDAHPETAKRHGFADYVGYVQAREAERREQADPTLDMAKRWSRVDDRRAASRFEALNYEPPDTAARLTPAEVRAAVGVEKFEQGTEAALPIAPVATALARAERPTVAREEPHRETRAAPPPEREAESSAGSTGSNASGGGEGGSGSTGSSGGAEKNPWTWPARSGPQPAETQRLDALRHLDAQSRQPAPQPRAAGNSVTSAPTVGRSSTGTAGGKSASASTGSRSKDTSAATSSVSGGPSASTPGSWRAPRMPKRPKSVSEERAMLASFGRPVMAHLNEHDEQHKEAGGGVSAWWKRTMTETSELWHEARDAARDWVQNRWNSPTKGPEPGVPEPKGHHGPDIER